MKSWCILVGVALVSSLDTVCGFSLGTPMVASRTHLRSSTHVTRMLIAPGPGKGNQKAPVPAQPAAKKAAAPVAKPAAKMPANPPAKPAAKTGTSTLLAKPAVVRAATPAPATEKVDEEPKETFVNKLLGPKLFKSVTDVNGVHQVPLVALRVLAGILMIHHGSEGGFWPANFGTEAFNGFDQFITQKYFSFLPGPSTFWSAVHDYIEFWGAAALAAGAFTRPAALALFGTMVSAVYFHLSSTGLQGAPFGHVKNYSYDFEEPALYALVFLVFFFNGAGPLSIDSIIYNAIKKEDDNK